MSKRYLCKFFFKGTNYFGTQVQPDKLTVNQVIEEAAQKINLKARFKYYSRLDGGVHAFSYPVFLDVKSFNGNLKPAFNFVLPDDIKLRRIIKIPDSVDEKKLISEKVYRYYFYFSRTSNPFVDPFALRMLPKDLSKVDEILKEFVGEKDFASFQTTGSQVKTTIRTIKSFRLVSKSPTFHYFEIEGTGFLKNQVRLMVGTIFKYLEGKISLSTVRQMLEKKTSNPSLVGQLMPAKGLFLYKVRLSNIA